jgi:hypothetical protein
VLSEKEKQELREMAASDSLREEFRTIRRNSEAIARKITVDELAHWLTVMARLFPVAPKAKQAEHYVTMKL